MEKRPPNHQIRVPFDVIWAVARRCRGQIWLPRPRELRNAMVIALFGQLFVVIGRFGGEVPETL